MQFHHAAGHLSHVTVRPRHQSTSACFPCPWDAYLVRSIWAQMYIALYSITICRWWTQAKVGQNNNNSTRARNHPSLPAGQLVPILSKSYQHQSNMARLPIGLRSNNVEHESDRKGLLSNSILLDTKAVLELIHIAMVIPHNVTLQPRHQSTWACFPCPFGLSVSLKVYLSTGVHCSGLTLPSAGGESKD